MVKFDSKTKKVELDLPEGEGQFMKEVSSIVAVLRDQLYVNGHTEDEVNNMCFAAFKLGMENKKVFPHSPEAAAAIAKLAKKSHSNRELPV